MTREQQAIASNFGLILRSIKVSVVQSAVERAAHPLPPKEQEAALKSHLEARDNFLDSMCGCDGE